MFQTISCVVYLWFSQWLRRERGHLTQGWFFFFFISVCMRRRRRVFTPTLSTDTQSNWIVCVVIATPITKPLAQKVCVCVCVCVWRRLERIQEDSSLFFHFSLWGSPHKRRNDWKLIGAGGSPVKHESCFIFFFFFFFAVKKHFLFSYLLA